MIRRKKHAPAWRALCATIAGLQILMRRSRSLIERESIGNGEEDCISMRVKTVPDFNR
jgi:hypothetical protein